MSYKIPNFFCLGAQKSGTTTLHNIFQQHPEVYLPGNKEAPFFHKDHLYELGIEWYLEKYFSSVQDQKVKGSFTPEYLYFTKTAKRLLEAFGKNLKFLIVLRNPADRAFSHYKMSKFRGYEKLPFMEAIKEEEKRITQSLDNKIHYSYIDRGYYHSQISAYLELFPYENFKILIFEKHIIRNLEQTVIDIQDFIGVERLSLHTDIKSNPAKDAHFPFLNRILIDTPQTVLKISKFIPKGFKTAFRKVVKNNNRKRQKVRKLEPELRDLILQKYFAKDIAQLEKLLQLNTGWINNTDYV